MKRNRKAKIVATLGPASSTRPRIAELHAAGVDVFRLNFSHGSHAEHQQRYDIIRSLEKQTGRPVGILMDLQGPKLRIGTFGNGPIKLIPGSPFRLDLLPEPGNTRRVTLPHPELFPSLTEGTELLLDDGKLRLRVAKSGNDFVDTQVVTGGELSNHKGVNVPGAVLGLSALTDKDRNDLDFGLKLGVDWVALSFVQRPEDVAEVRAIVNGRAGVLAKLEKPAALDHLEQIIQLSDAIMVARGDLGVECAPEDVPAQQKRIIRACREAGRPVVVATQMLDSMVRAPAPTRAEASDVATAVYDGADAVMLSAETAAGDYPIEAVSIMDRIICSVERDPQYRVMIDRTSPSHDSSSADAIAEAAGQVARTTRAMAIVSFTASGSTALRVARERPEVPILGLTPSKETARRLALVWGVHSVETSDVHHFNEMVRKAVRTAVREGFGRVGQRLAVVAGVPFGKKGTTNTLHVAKIDEAALTPSSS